ncbi:MAG: SMC-Scp complex subunit ScpB, partial [Chthoniobacterales bacterium]|nr:SMC-Scp complex subunit ScpB [Chthoniobacterales bacterium]
LMERGLVKIGGRAEVPGRPLLYETTQFFLDHFALRNLDELPNADELRRRYLPTAPVPAVQAPVAADSGELDLNVLDLAEAMPAGEEPPPASSP